MPALWISYFDITHILEVLDAAQEGPVLNAALDAISFFPPRFEHALAERLDRLFALLVTSSNSAIIQPLIALAINSTIPIGLASSSSAHSTLTELIHQGCNRWANRKNHISMSIDLSLFLEQETWQDSTVEIITGLLRNSKTLPRNWIKLISFSQHSDEHVALVLSVVAESFTPSRYELEEVENLRLPLAKLVDGTMDAPTSIARHNCASAIKSIAKWFAGAQVLVQETVAKRLERTLPDALTLEMLFLSDALGDAVTRQLVDLGFQWASRNLSTHGGKSNETQMANSISKFIYTSPFNSNLLCSPYCQGNYTIRSSCGKLPVGLHTTMLAQYHCLGFGESSDQCFSNQGTGNFIPTNISKRAIAACC